MAAVTKLTLEWRCVELGIDRKRLCYGRARAPCFNGSIPHPRKVLHDFSSIAINRGGRSNILLQSSNHSNSNRGTRINSHINTVAPPDLFAAAVTKLMELFTSPTSFITSILLFFLSLELIHRFTNDSKKEGKPKLPPGPSKLPIIGSMHHLAGGLPHQALAAVAKKHGPIMHLQLGEISTVVISGARMAKEVLKTHDLAFANRPKLLAAEVITYNYQDIAMAPYGDYWKQMRKICVFELLSAKSTRASRFIREDEVWKMINSIQSSASKSQPVDLSEKAFALTNSITCRATFGSRCKDQDQLVKLINEIMEVSTGFDISDLFPSKKFIHVISGTASKIKKIQAKLDPIFENIIEEQKEINRAAATDSSSGDQAEDQDNLVAVLLKVNERGGHDVPITTNSIKAVFVDMFSGGTDTAATTVTWAMSELMRNPKTMEKAQAEVRSILEGKNRINEEDIKGLNYLKLVIRETLRMHPPVPLMLPRECREQCQINGYDIPVMTKVILNASAVNRDPEFWQDPDTFEPERFANTGIDFLGNNYEYIPFGGGRRICPGISFGLANVELALSQLLYHFDWKLPNGAEPESLDMDEAFGTAVKRKNNLCLVATTHVPFESVPDAATTRVPFESVPDAATTHVPFESVPDAICKFIS